MYKLPSTIILMFACACGQIPDREAFQDHDEEQHQDEAYQSTLFSDHTEFFVEYGPLVVNEESVFLVHVTHLSTYKPYSSGTVTIEMDGSSVRSGEPERPGIFLVPFLPARKGEFMITYTLESGAVKDSVTQHIVVFSDHDELHADEASRVDHGAEISSSEITFPKEQSWKNEFMVEEIVPMPFSSAISTSGEIMSIPGVKKIVAASNSGMVIFADNYLVQGSRVTRGQILFTISSKALLDNNVELQYQESLNQLNMSRSEYGRHALLFEKKVISERQLIASRATYIADSLHFYNLSANTTEEGLKVKAPITGFIHELSVSEGQYVETGQSLVTVYSDHNLLIRADLPQQYFNHLNEIATANFRTAYSERTYALEEFHGKLIATGSSVAENNHYLPLYFEVENDGRLLEGAFAQIFIKTNEKGNCLTIPLNAILEEQGSHYLYVQVNGVRYTKRPVKLGGNDGIRAEVIDGLSPGERIVTNGVMLIKAASLVTGAIGDGHAH